MSQNDSPAPPTVWDRMTRTLAHYERIEQIGEGTYGQVYRAKCLDSGRIVAMKKIRVHHGGYWGMPPTVLREIKILKRLRHPHLVEMLEVVSSKGVEYLDENDAPPEEKGSKRNSTKKDKVVDAREAYKGSIYLVLEYVSHDLTGLMDVAFRFTEVQVKSIFRQLLEALNYMHDNKYVHRDIKSSNILIDSHFRVKLADFGLARCIEPPILDTFNNRGSQQEFTNKVITLWYRPPEILLGATRYGFPVDVWSAGCILAELLLGKPLFTGKTEMDQLQLIFDLLGTPTAETWDGLDDLKLLRTGEVTIEKQREPRLREKYSHRLPTPALNLLEKLLELDPQKRLTAGRALTSRYFLSDPRAPENPAELGVLQFGEGGGHFHEFQTKKKRREAKAVAKKASEDARAMGMSEKEAEVEYDAVYRECMKQVAEEGNAALGPVSTKKIDGDAPVQIEQAAMKEGVSGERKSNRNGGADLGHRRDLDDVQVAGRDNVGDRKRRRQSKENFIDHSEELFARRDSTEEAHVNHESTADSHSADDHRGSRRGRRSSRDRDASPRDRPRRQERNDTASRSGHDRDNDQGLSRHKRHGRSARMERDDERSRNRKGGSDIRGSSLEIARSTRHDARERHDHYRMTNERNAHSQRHNDNFGRDRGIPPGPEGRRGGRAPRLSGHAYQEPTRGRFMPPESFDQSGRIGRQRSQDDKDDRVDPSRRRLDRCRHRP